MSKFLNVLGLIVAVWASIQGFAGELSPSVAAILVIGGTTLSALNESLLKATDLGVVSWLAPVAAAALAAVDGIGQAGLSGAAGKWVLGLKIIASALTAASAKLKTTPTDNDPPDPFDPRNGSILSILLICTLGLTACGDKEAKALRDTAVGINKIGPTLLVLKDEGFISEDTFQARLRDLKDVTEAHKEAVGLYRQFDKITPENKAAVLIKVDALLASLERLQSNTRIRDSTKAVAFAAITSGIRTNVAVIRAFVEAAK